MADIERKSPDGVYKPFKGIYSQVVKSKGEEYIHMAGVAAMDEDFNFVGKGDMGKQCEQTWKNIGKILESVGAKPSDVVKINVYATDVDAYIKEGVPHLENFFGDQRPASTTIEVPRLVQPDWLVEIECIAVIG